MHLLLAAEDSEQELLAECEALFAGYRVLGLEKSLVQADFRIRPGERLPHLAFARQLLPEVEPIRAESIRAWADLIFDKAVLSLPENQSWRLQVTPQYGKRSLHRMGARAWHSELRKAKARGERISQVRAGLASSQRESRTAVRGVEHDAGQHRCQLIRKALVEAMHQKRRHLLRRLHDKANPFTREDSLIQLLLTEPTSGFLSLGMAPLPFEQRHLISPFPKGEVPVSSDKNAPSRAFAKLAEAELRLGRPVRPGESCVDLGASPGSWTYHAVNQGARVIAVDRSGLREDLMRHPRVEFQAGDAFGFRPKSPVDWLLCDVIAPPDSTAELLLEWLRQRWCRNFVVTLKLKESAGNTALDRLRAEVPALAQDFFLMRLCANKKEVCAFGSIRT